MFGDDDFNIWESIFGAGDMNFDGGVDMTDAMIRDDMDAVTESGVSGYPAYHERKRREYRDADEEEEEEDEEDEYGDDEYDDEEDDDEYEEDDDEYEEDDDEYCDEECEDYADKKYSTRIPADFIIRDRKAEKSLGIDDIKFYAYWYNEDELKVVGQYIASGAIETFRMEARIYDLDGDLLHVEEFDTQVCGNCFCLLEVREGIFFNGYPFSVSLPIQKSVFAKRRIKFVLRKDKNWTKKRPTATINLEKLLQTPCKEQPRYAAHMQEGEKLPSGMLTYYTEKGSGIDSLKFVFYKYDDSSSEYWANLMGYSCTISGKLKKEMFSHVMGFNEKNELIFYDLHGFDEGEYDDDASSYLESLPPAEKLARIVIYTGWQFGDRQ